MSLDDRARSFGEVAEEYHRWRPTYPPEAVDWLAPAAPAHVADVGAGTGKLTELLLARGLEVEAVEPDGRMLDVLVRNSPAARAHLSTSSRLPVGDRTLDAVLVADAWHWLEPEPTITELRRVLRPGGWLGLVWNVTAEPVQLWEHVLASDSDEYDRRSKASNAGLNTRLSYFEQRARVAPRGVDVGRHAVALGFAAGDDLDGDGHDAGGPGGILRSDPREAAGRVQCARHGHGPGPSERELRPLDAQVLTGCSLGCSSQVRARTASTTGRTRSTCRARLPVSRLCAAKTPVGPSR